MIPVFFRRLQCLRYGPYWLIAVLALLWLTTCTSTPAGLSRPNGVALAADGSLYVMDRGNYRVVHLSPAGQTLNTFGQLGSGPADLYSGWDIALDPAGNIYVCNFVFSEEGSFILHDGIKVFTPAGQFLREIGGQDYAYKSSGAPNTPYGLDIDNEGRVYVADFGVNRIRVFDAGGRLVTTLLGELGRRDGQVNGVVDVAVDDQRHLLYISDQFNSRIQQFDLAITPSGEISLTHRRTIGTYGREPGQFAYPQNLAVDDRSGRLYVGDMANRRIQVLGDDGRFITEMTVPQDWQVFGLAVGPDNAIYAVDALNNLIWVFEPDGRLRGQIGRAS